jgi:succinate dehydrogenase flavin-adding protein (antitoxin of CptAB toxin-antitoxin module)
MNKKYSIESLPHTELIKLTDAQLVEWCDQNHVHAQHSWMLPQIVARMGGWVPQRSDGTLDVLLTLQRGCTTTLDQLCWRLARLPRSALIKGQVTNPQYSQLVPLLLLAWKQQYGIPYNAWRGCERLDLVLEPKLYEMVNLSGEQLEVIADLGSEQLLELRDRGLWNNKAQKTKSATSTWALTGIMGTPLGKLPKLTQTILTQIWLAHPTKRNTNMILDPLNWDNIPAPLVSTEPLLETTTTPSNTSYKLPWL